MRHGHVMIALMRIIFLNTLNGKVAERMKDFMLEQAPMTDIFCLQEVYDSSKSFFEELLSEFSHVYTFKSITEDGFPQATYVKPGTEIIFSTTVLDEIPNTGIGLYTHINAKNGNVIHVCNVHGRAFPGEKLDTPERLRQSRGFIDFFTTLDGPKIIGGDFNVLPDTESIRMFEQRGYIDLIKKHNVRTTRNQLAWANYPDNKQYYSDYVFVSPDVKVQNFLVPENEISDHLPLVLDIES